jgi:hypothetical protein
MKEVNLIKYAEELNAMQTLPAVSVKLPPLAALAIISHIQLAIRHPQIADSEFAQIAKDVAKQLQNLFNKDSETLKMLERGWNPEADSILTPSGELNDECEEPCEKFLQNLGCRCTGYKVAEVVAGNDISPQALAAGAALFHQLKGNFVESYRFEGFLDM